jgi:hypothetical protein
MAETATAAPTPGPQARPLRPQARLPPGDRAEECRAASDQPIPAASPIPRRDDAVGRLEAALAEQDRRRHQYEAASGTSLEPDAYARLCEAKQRVATRERWLAWIDQRWDRRRSTASREETFARGGEMTPMRFFEGSRTKPERLGEERDLAKRRLAALALAVRQHEDTARRQTASPARPQDRQLYRRLRQICGEGSAG